MPEKLTDVELLLANNLSYTDDLEVIPSIYNDKYLGYSIEKFAKEVDNSIDKYNETAGSSTAFNGKEEVSMFESGQEWKDVFQAVKEESNLGSYVITDTAQDTTGGKAILLTSPDQSEAVLIYRGTGKYEFEDGTSNTEWPDDVYGAGPTTASDRCSTNQQVLAKHVYDYFYTKYNLSQYDTVTVTGHSKGGNKAAYVTILDQNDTITRTVSVDGQGMSDEFVQTYYNEIEKNQGKIRNLCSEGDYVNILLNTVGNAPEYLKNNQDNINNGNFAENHTPNAFLFYGPDGKAFVKQGEQTEALVILNNFINSYLRSMSPEKKQKTVEYFGDLVKDIKSGKRSVGELFFDSEFKDEMQYLHTCLTAFDTKYPGAYSAIISIIPQLNLGIISENFIIALIGALDFYFCVDEKTAQMMDAGEDIAVPIKSDDLSQTGGALLEMETGQKTYSPDSPVSVAGTGSAAFEIRVRSVKKAGEDFCSIKKKTDQICAVLDGICESLKGELQLVKEPLQTEMGKVKRVGTGIYELGKAAIQVAGIYEKTEKAVCTSCTL